MSADQIIDLAKWAIPPIIGYLIWVHRELITLRAKSEQAGDKLVHHDQTFGMITAQLSAIAVTLARLEERVTILLRKEGA